VTRSNQLSYMPKKETTNWVMMASSLPTVAGAALTSASRRMSYMPKKETTNRTLDGLVITHRGGRCSNQLSYMPKKRNN
ncbi:MAG TPA: hypothetical protein PK547_00005, partial [Candidatus Paceibacterota bacterium]|nr:hypothetical protein [Candidatus Paceibacterota bacterium]